MGVCGHDVGDQGRGIPGRHHSQCKCPEAGALKEHCLEGKSGRLKGALRMHRRVV